MAFGLLLFLVDEALTLLAEGGSLPLPSVVPVVVIVTLAAYAAPLAVVAARRRYVQ